MDIMSRVEEALESALVPLLDEDCPARLAGAIRASLFPGGARIRPKLLLGVSDACGVLGVPLAARAAAAIEMLHCASLVQDDLVCFDDAATRRGRPALHVAYDERLAILASDALIVGAFDQIADSEEGSPEARLALVSLLSRRVGSRGGITAGQAWESESEIDLEAYHRAKTGALFAAATEAGAIAGQTAAGRPIDHHAAAWRRTGECIGFAYQIADDLHDVIGCAETMGKPVSVDRERGRPNAAHALGIEGAAERLALLIEEIVDTVPPCPHGARLIATIRDEASRFLPKGLARSAA